MLTKAPYACVLYTHTRALLVGAVPTRPATALYTEVCLMTERILAALVQFITHVIDMGGYVGIAALMGIESACIPLPSEIIMPFAGYLVYLQRFNLVWAATAGAIGCNLGSVVAYWIGAKGGRPLVERYGRWVLMSNHDLHRMTYFFNRYGSVTVLLARLLPVVRTFIAFPAGIAKMPQLRFHIYTFVGSWPWCFALTYAGMKLGEKWHTDPRFEHAFHRFHLAVEIALVAAIVWFVWSHLDRRRQSRSREA
jgi:membrane protein DedA with SNARE-associated domain